MKVRVKWDCKRTTIVPKTIEVPDDIETENVADWLSDNYGWCVIRWKEV